jgi:hypothetical protein
MKIVKANIVSVATLAGGFAEDKDVARQIRQENVLPHLAAGDGIILDFSKVEVATQSFIHAMISEALRIYNGRALELLEFKSCNATVKSVILTVIEYSLSPSGTAQSGTAQHPSA